MINIGIIGLGMIANQAYGPALSLMKNAKLRSVLTRSEEKGDLFVEKFSPNEAPALVFTDIDLFFSDLLLDAVIICAPDKLHMAYIEKAIAAEKHILCEKPLVTNIEELTKLEKILDNSPLVLSVCFHHRWHNGIRKLRSMIVDDGILGPIRRMRVHWSIQAKKENNWRATSHLGKWWSGGALGPHCFDIVRWFMEPSNGDIQDLKNIHGSPRWGSENDELSSTLLLYQSGAIAEINTSVICQPCSSIEIYGDNGTAKAFGILGSHGGGNIELSGKNLPYKIDNPFKGLLNNFVLAVEKKEITKCGFDEGRKNVFDLLSAYS